MSALSSGGTGVPSGGRGGCHRRSDAVSLPRAVLLLASPALLAVQSRPSRYGACRSSLTRRSALAPLADPAVVDTVEPLAEATYYILENHDRFWVVAFDIDARDIAVKRRADEVYPRGPPARFSPAAASPAGPPVQPAPAHDP